MSTPACLRARWKRGDYFDFLNFSRTVNHRRCFRQGDRRSSVDGEIPCRPACGAVGAGLIVLGASSGQNRLFYDNTDDSAYVTFLFIEYDEEKRRLRYVNCGHLSGLLVRRDGKVDA